MADEKTLKETLFYTKKTVYELAEEEQIQAAYDYAEGYKKFLDAAKTERESVTESIKLAEAAGFKPYAFGDAVKAGDRLYCIYGYVDPGCSEIVNKALKEKVSYNHQYLCRS
jgi:hypothetical protein